MSYSDKIPLKIFDRQDMIRQAHRCRLESKKVVFTNGVFDLLHRGHVDYLMKAADLGNYLIIGLNSDTSVKLLNKGGNRPIQDEFSRAVILSSLVFVNAVVIFNEETPEKLIQELRPDVLVKGGDYQINQIAGSDFVLKNGGLVQTIPLVEGYSTTAIENRIKSA